MPNDERLLIISPKEAFFPPTDSISLIDISENFLINLFIFKCAIPISKLNIFLQ